MERSANPPLCRVARVMNLANQVGSLPGLPREARTQDPVF